MVLNIVQSHDNVMSESVGPNDKLYDDLGLDSLDVCEIIMSLEKELSIVVTNEEEIVVLKGSATVQSIIDVIVKKFYNAGV